MHVRIDLQQLMNGLTNLARIFRSQVAHDDSATPPDQGAEGLLFG